LRFPWQRSNSRYGVECPGSPASENSDRAHLRRSEIKSAHVPRRAAPDETGTSLQAEQFTPPPKRLLQGTRRLGGTKKSFGDLPLVLDGEPDNLGSFDSSASGFTRRRNDKIRESAPFDFSSTLQQRMNIVRQTRFKPGGGMCSSCAMTLFHYAAIRRTRGYRPVDLSRERAKSGGCTMLNISVWTSISTKIGRSIAHWRVRGELLCQEL
jgi:hypothetical protein